MLERIIQLSRDHPRVCGEEWLSGSSRLSGSGSPPRVRGGVGENVQEGRLAGITPACAGRRTPSALSAASARDHPRVCGEEKQHLVDEEIKVGSPPRVRGGVSQSERPHLFLGITPACAGRRRPSGRRSLTRWDHPRVCGEEWNGNFGKVFNQGSPPRVRGGVGSSHPHDAPQGITPACAGRSVGVNNVFGCPWDHPRVCGEEVVAVRIAEICAGSPPRVRGGVKRRSRRISISRITPACAGRRLVRSSPVVRSLDHPRVCGEEPRRTIPAGRGRGSPPRVRGGVVFTELAHHLAGITPACAGRREQRGHVAEVCRDHPRVCGEEGGSRNGNRVGEGSPPRVRGGANAARP